MARQINPIIKYPWGGEGNQTCIKVKSWGFKSGTDWLGKQTESSTWHNKDPTLGSNNNI